MKKSVIYEISETEYMDSFSRFALVYPSGIVIDRKLNKIVPIRPLRLMHPTMTRLWLASDKKTIIKTNNSGSNELYTFTNVEFATEPGNIDLALELLFNLCGKNEKTMRWLLCWLAYPMQNVGAKIRTALLLYGCPDPMKNLLIQHLICRIYPKPYTEILTHKMINGKKNWISGKLLVVGSELDNIKGSSSGSMSLEGLIKQSSVYTTHRPDLRIREGNHANFIFLSNKITPPEFAFINNGKCESMYYTLIRQNKSMSQRFYQKCHEYFSTPEGQSAFADYLLKFNCGSFNERNCLLSGLNEDTIFNQEVVPNRFGSFE